MSTPSTCPTAGPTLAFYNPNLLSDADVRDQFVARAELLDRLLDTLRQADRPGHHLLLGQRGMGKTTLLRRLRAAIEDDPELSARWLPLSFPEEQYNVTRISDLWVNCMEALGETLDRRGDTAGVTDIDTLIESLPTAEGPRAEAAQKLLQAQAQTRGSLVLLVDNLDLVLDRLKAYQWTLREVLSESEHLVLIGTSSSLPDGVANYGDAFYDFFAHHLLERFSRSEAEVLLLRIGELKRAQHLPTLLRTQPGRFKALYVLTGGTPRTIVLLYPIIAQQGDPKVPSRSVRLDLEALLDVCTPVYKARVEAMSAQAQQVFHALALAWDPRTAAELAAAARLELNLSSAILHRLVKEGLVEQVSLPDTRRVGFQVAERFFNIWFLMRAGGQARRRLSDLVGFLELIYATEDVPDPALGGPNETDRGAHGEEGLAMTRARLGHELLLRQGPEGNTPAPLVAEPPIAKYTLAHDPNVSSIDQYGTGGTGTERGTNVPIDPYPLRTHPSIFGHAQHWAVAEGTLRRWLQTAEDVDYRHEWPRVLTLFADACATGRAKEAADLLLAAALDERWRPLYAALRAVESGDPRRLLRFAPEIRAPAFELLEKLAPPLVVGSQRP